MPQFIFAYHGGKTPQTEEEGKREMELWEKWFAEMGEAVAIPGNPVGKSKTVSSSGVEDHGGANPISGFTVIDVADIDAATEMAKGCPMVVDGSGSIEVAPVLEM
ncbi:MAG: YciI family protein [Pseudomonadota bacterium]